MRNTQTLACSDYFPNAMRDKIEGNRENNVNESSNSIPYHKLYGFADVKDNVLMFVGSVAAVANGFCLPVMTILFGKLVDAIGKHPLDVKSQVRDVCEVLSSKICTLMFVHLLFLNLIWPIASPLQNLSNYLQVSLHMVYFALATGVLSFFRNFHTSRELKY